jgi:Xaa-Pro aminopeptidase
VAYAGLSPAEKLAQLNVATPTMITDMASVNWLLNVRGNDVPYTPVLQAFALVMPQADVTLFVNLEKVPAALPSYITCVDLSQLTQFNYPKTLVADPATCPAALWQHWQNHNIVVQTKADSAHMARTLKNSTELAGAQQAHIYDGVAMVQFLHCFSQQQHRTDLTEIDMVQKLQSLRAQQPHYFSDSFATIAGAGPNGAIVHYKPEPETCRTLEPNELMLLDSGAQYNMGTTDITRTLWFGQNQPNAQARHIYTNVLKSHIAAACAIFPNHKTTGVQIDALARAPLWAQGLDFGHGLGHGVGSFASVHDGAVGLSPRSQGVLAPFMLLTIEPGVYLENTLGVRLENVYAVETHSTFDQMLCFAPLTLAPFDNQLIDNTQLTLAEKTWLNNYHQTVLNTLTPLLDKACATWLHAYVLML